MKNVILLSILFVSCTFFAFMYLGGETRNYLVPYLELLPIHAKREITVKLDPTDLLYKEALAHFWGKGIPVDKKKALELYLKAAEKDHLDAQYATGIMYHYGHGTEKNLEQAEHWYKISAQRGHTKAQFHIANLLSNKEYAQVDYFKAGEWYKKAADAGNVDAADHLQEMDTFCTNQAYKSADLIWTCIVPAAGGQLLSKGMLSYMYARGYGFEQDLKEAERWGLDIAFEGEPLAQLSMIYTNINKAASVDVKKASTTKFLDLMIDELRKENKRHLLLEMYRNAVAQNEPMGLYDVAYIWTKVLEKNTNREKLNEYWLKHSEDVIDHMNSSKTELLDTEPAWPERAKANEKCAALFYSDKSEFKRCVRVDE